MDRLEAHRQFYANLVTTSAGAAKNERLKDAFAATPREHFVGAGPWKVFAGGIYLETPSADPAFLYQDVVVALAPERGINNGQPVLHAINLAALNVKQGEKVLHVGAGTGYYTAVLARLAGATETVVSYEIEHDLAQNAIQNLSDFSNVSVKNRSGSEAPLPVCDVIYVNAGATAPLNVWLDALQLNGRLLFPLTPADGPGGMPGAGGMLLITRNDTDRFDARFICPTMFVPCAGARDEETAQKLSVAFKRGDFRNVRSLRRIRALKQRVVKEPIFEAASSRTEELLATAMGTTRYMNLRSGFVHRERLCWGFVYYSAQEPRWKCKFGLGNSTTLGGSLYHNLH